MKGKTVLLVFGIFFLISFFKPSFAETFYTPTSETVCSGGSCTTTLYIDYMFFINSSGKYEMINGTPEYGNFDGYDYRAIKGFYQAYYKSHLSYGDSIMFCSDNYCFTIQPSKLTYRNPSNSNDDIFSSPNTTNIGYPSENSFSWDNVFGSYDLSYQYFPTSLKENLVLDDKPRTPATSLGDVSLVTMDIDTYIKYPVGVDLYFANGTKITGNIITSERLEFRNSTNNILYSLPEPYAYDINGSKVMLNYQIVWDKKYNQNQERLIWFYIKTPYEWLNSSERVYPIYIDPTVYYNFTVVNNNKAYGDSSDAGTVVTADGSGDFADEPNPTFTEVFTRTVSNFTAGGYSMLSTLNNGFANLTSPGSNNEPFGKYNFTINQPSTTINWINVTMSQKEIVGAGSTEHCYYGITNFTGSDMFDFASPMDGTTVVTGSYNFTNNAEIQKLIDANKQLVMINWGTLSDAGDGCAVDWVSVIVNYNSTMTFSSPSTNVSSNAAPNTIVNFSITTTTNNDDISHYLFSSNFSDGTWRNTSWVSLAGTQTTGSIGWANTSTASGIYGWKFCANTSTNFVNCSDVQAYNFTSRNLLVSWTPYNAQSQINDTTCQIGTPCSYAQYSTFNASGNVTCLTNPAGQSCGSITGGIMYNNTTTTYKWINTTEDTPFYLITSGQTVTLVPNPSTNKAYKNTTNLEMCTSGQFSIINTEFTDADYNNVNTSNDNRYQQTAVAYLLGGYNCTVYKFTFNTSGYTGITQIGLLHEGYYQITDVGNAYIYLYNITLGSWVVWTAINEGSTDTNKTLIPAVADIRNNTDGMVTFAIMVKANAQTIIAVTDAFTDYARINVTYGATNPYSIGTLTDGSSYLLNYTVNATDTPTKTYNMTFNFSGSLVTTNYTPTAFVQIGTAGPQTRSTLQSFSLSGTASKGGNFSKSAIEPFSTTSAIIGAFAAIRAASQTMLFSQLISKLYFSFRALSQSLSLIPVTSRITNLFRTFSAYFGVNNVVMKGLVYLKSISDSFVTNTAITRISILSKLLTQSFNVNILTTRISTLLKSLSQYFSTNAITERTALLLRSTAQSISINTLVSRILSLFRSISSPFIINIETIRTGLFLKSVTDSFATNIITARVASFFKNIQNSFALSSTITRELSFLRTTSQSFITNTLITRLANFLRTTPQSLTVSMAAARLQLLVRTISQSFSLSSTASRVLSLFKEISTSFSANIEVFRTGLFLRSLSNSFAVNIAISRIQMLIKSLTLSFGFIDTITKGLFYLRETSTYFIANTMTSRIAVFSKALTQYFSITEITSRTTMLLKLLSQPFTMNAITTRLLEFLKTVSTPFSTNIATTRTGMFLKSISDSFTANIVISRIQTLTKSISQFFTTNVIATGEKVAGLYKKTAELILTVTDISGRLLNIRRIIPQSLSLNIIADKITYFFKSMSETFKIDALISRVYRVFKPITEFFTTNIAIARTGLFIKSLSQSIATNIIASRIQSLLKPVTTIFGIADSVARGFTYIRTITQSFITNTTIARIMGFYRTISQQFSTYVITTRIQGLIKTLSQPILTNAFTTRVTILYKSLTQTIGINAVTSRILGFLKTVSTSFTTNIIASRTGLFLKSVSDSFTTNLVISRIAYISQRVSQLFGINQVVSRAFFISRQIIQSLSINDFTSRLITLQRSVTGSFIFNISTQRIQILLKSISQIFSLTEISARISTILKVTTTSFGINDVISRITSFSRVVTQGLSISGMVLRLQFLIRTFAEQLSVSQNAIGFKVGQIWNRFVSMSFSVTDSVRRILIFTRIVSQSFNLNIVMNRLLSLIRIILQAFGIYTIGSRPISCESLTTEANCANYGCYYCVNVCQTTPCPAPTQPPLTGGGLISFCGNGICGYGENSLNCPQDCLLPTKIVLDTDIRIEAGSEQTVAGQRVYATITILKAKGPEGVVNIDLTYWIRNPSGEIINMKKTTIGIETIRSDIYYLTLPPNSPLGTYVFEALAQYDNETDTSSETFEVVSKLPAALISIEKINVPLMFMDDETTLSVILENQAENPLNVTAIMFFPDGFRPRNVTVTKLIEPLTEELFEFSTTPYIFGSFDAFISIKYDGRGLTRDFVINVYPPLVKYGWVLVLILLTIIIILLYRRRRKEFYHRIKITKMRRLVGR